MGLTSLSLCSFFLLSQLKQKHFLPMKSCIMQEKKKKKPSMEVILEEDRLPQS